MAKKTAKTKKPRRQKRGAKKGGSKTVRVDTHDLFQESSKLKALVTNVLKKLDGDDEEKEGLKKFLGTLGEIRLLIKTGCREINGGNPMFHNFKVKVRA